MALRYAAFSRFGRNDVAAPSSFDHGRFGHDENSPLKGAVFPGTQTPCAGLRADATQTRPWIVSKPIGTHAPSGGPEEPAGAGADANHEPDGLEARVSAPPARRIGKSPPCLRPGERDVSLVPSHLSLDACDGSPAMPGSRPLRQPLTRDERSAGSGRSSAHGSWNALPDTVKPVGPGARDERSSASELPG